MHLVIWNKSNKNKVSSINLGYVYI